MEWAVGSILHTPRETGNLSGVRKRSLLIPQPPGAEKHRVECREREGMGKPLKRRLLIFLSP